MYYVMYHISFIISYFRIYLFPLNNVWFKNFGVEKEKREKKNKILRKSAMNCRKKVSVKVRNTTRKLYFTDRIY